ncbi:Mo-dependent nitrogenase C-terminal domain-containing protein [Nostoc sp. PA-18-2419]|uniref:Mo-dependent nitrogenase C-terminal domain-containing protein n=1 Tax=Nostoc sp. PA-18-2419 TaxID=2575443 RepID=UPI001108FB4E|nr:Mo-dependent nitrogenase C-terminal domain-containing protein [Nostoc sp. PA-18-2419]
MLKTNNRRIFLPGFISPLQENNLADSKKQIPQQKLDLLQPLRQWLDKIKIENRKFAKFIAKLIPAQCPFERDIMLFGRIIGHIPPMCKLNPLYDELISLRFRALCYLVDQCGEDIQSYC